VNKDALRNVSAPVLLGTPLLSIAENAGVTPDMADLGYAFRRPIWIDEVRFMCMIPNLAFAGGFSVRANLRLGRMQITGSRNNPFVPIWSFGTRQQPLGLVDQVVDTVANQCWSHFRWILPKPLYVPAGQILMSTFFRQADGGGAGGKVGVAYAGRTVAPGTPMPSKISVPYVGVYEPPAGAASAISSELDLVNPFLVPLKVQRFTMRVLDSTGAGLIKAENLQSGANRQITMKDSSGYDIVTDAAPMLEVGFGARRAWTFNRTLGPKERFIVNYNNLAPSESVFPTIAMVGWRDEVFK